MMWRRHDYQALLLSGISEMFSRNMHARERDQLLHVLAHDGLLSLGQGASTGGRAPMHVGYNSTNRPDHPTTDW